MTPEKAPVTPFARLRADADQLLTDISYKTGSARAWASFYGRVIDVLQRLAASPATGEGLREAIAEIEGMSIKGRGIFAQGYAQARTDVLARLAATTPDTEPHP